MADVATIGHVFIGQLPRAQREEHCLNCGCSWDDRNAKQCRLLAQRHLDLAQSLHSFEGAQADSDILAIAQALADAEQRGAEQRGAESVRYSTERGARQELWSFIRLHAGKSETQNVSVEWLDAFAPEMVSGRFADIGPKDTYSPQPAAAPKVLPVEEFVTKAELAELFRGGALKQPFVRFAWMAEQLERGGEGKGDG